MVMQQLLHNTADTSRGPLVVNGCRFRSMARLQLRRGGCSWSTADKKEHDNHFSVDLVYRVQKGRRGVLIV